MMVILRKRFIVELQATSKHWPLVQANVVAEPARQIIVDITMSQLELVPHQKALVIISASMSMALAILYIYLKSEDAWEMMI